MKKLLLFFSLFSFSIAQAQILTDTGQIRSYVNANIVTNGTKAITAVSLNKILNGYLNAWPSSGINTINTTGPLSWNAGTKTLSITGYNAANWNTVYNWYVAGGGGGSSVTGTKSINISSGVAQLQNDILSPGPGKVYGTDASGIRGWYNAPTGGAATTLATNRIAGRISAGTGVIEPIAPGKNITINSGQLDAIDVTYSAKNIGIPTSGDVTAALNTEALSSLRKTILFDTNLPLVISGNYNGQGKTHEFKNGAKITGGGTVRNLSINSNVYDQIFDTTIKAIGLQKTSIAMWGARRDYANPRLVRKSFQAAIDATPDGGTLFIPSDSVLGLNYYYSDSTVTASRNIIIIGDGSQHEPRSTIIWKSGVIGIHVLPGVRFEMHNVKLLSETPPGWTTFADWNDQIHATFIQGFPYIYNCTFQQWGGDGIHIDAQTGTGNADHGVIENCYFPDVANGVFTTGGDANIIKVEHNDFTQCRRWGYYNDGFLGDYAPNNHYADCGKTWQTLTNYNGVTYGAINLIGVPNIGKRPDLEPNFWRPMTFVFPSFGTWDTTKSYYSGGTYAVVNVNAKSLILNPYTESSQAGYFLNDRTLTLGGAEEASGNTGGVNVGASGGELIVSKGAEIRGNSRINGTLLANLYDARPSGGYSLQIPGHSLYGDGLFAYSNQLQFFYNNSRRAYFDTDNYLKLDGEPSGGDSSNKVASTGWVKRNVTGGGSGGTAISGLTANYVVKGASSSTVSSGSIYDNGSFVGIGTNTQGASEILRVNGTTQFQDDISFSTSGSKVDNEIKQAYGTGSIRIGVPTSWMQVYGSAHTNNDQIRFITASQERFRITPAGDFYFWPLGTGNIRLVQINGAGKLEQSTFDPTTVEVNTNKATSLTSPDNTHYPTTQAIVDYITTGVRISASATLDQVSIAAGGNNLNDISVTGAAVGDVVIIAQNSAEDQLVYTGWVTSSGTVRVRTQNISSSPIDPAPYTFKIIVVK